MGTIVTYPRERHAEGRQLTRAELTDEEGRTIRARIIIENVRNWIDSDENKIESMGMPRAVEPKLTPEQIEAKDAAGEGTFGHTTIFEPADLELYRSFMYPPLTMPANPQVMISYWDMNNPGPQHFMEGRVMVKAMCPDGIESWLVISVPVPNFHTCLEGNCWGWPKYVADEMTVEKDHSEVIYEGKPTLTLDFTPHDFDETTIQQLKDNGSEGGNTVSFHMSTGGVGQPTLMRQGTGPRKGGDTSHYAEWEAGMIKIWGRPEDKWSSLLPENCVVPGVWMRRVPTGGGGGGGMYKVTTMPAK